MTHPDLTAKIQTTLSKLRFIQDIQTLPQFWYADSTLLTNEDVSLANKALGDSIGSRFLHLGLSIGASFTNETTDETTIQLYKFNETLTRLLSNQTTRITTSISTSTDVSTTDTIDEMHGVLDCTLLIKTLITLLITKLEMLIHILETHKISAMETTLLNDILVKNISHKILVPFHSLLVNRAKLRLVDSLP